jgi:hypothetical protein
LPEPVNAIDLATFLQEDEVGCQTGAYREKDGAVILWHTEEDTEQTPRERFDKLRLFSFRALNGQRACGFIYPDLLPGPSFAWQAGFTQAIDTLHVKSVELADAILPNTLAWLSLYLGAQVSRTVLAQQLGPFRGGYSLTAVYKMDGRIDVEKVEFSNDAYFTSQLPQAPGSHLFQTNVIRDLSLPIGAQEQTSPESRAWNEKRMVRTERFVQVIKMSSEPLPLVFRMLQSRLGGDSAYANHDVKAYLVCRMTPEESTVWVGSGTPMPEDELYHEHNALGLNKMASMKKEKKLRLIYAVLLLMALFACGVIGYSNRSGTNLPDSSITQTALPGSTAVHELQYCSESDSLCVSSFGVDSAGNTLIILMNTSSSGKIYIKLNQSGAKMLFPCQEVKFNPDTYYCLGKTIPDQAKITLRVFSKEDNILLASGELLVQFGVTPEVLESQTPPTEVNP